MPLVVTTLLYLGCACVLLAAGGIGLSSLIEPASSQIARQIGHNIEHMAVIGPLVAAPTPDDTAIDRPPAWVASTPRYDMPNPGAAKRAVDAAKKAAGDHARKARIAKQRREQLLNDNALSAYGYAGPPRSFFSREMP